MREQNSSWSGNSLWTVTVPWIVNAWLLSDFILGASLSGRFLLIYGGAHGKNERTPLMIIRGLTVGLLQENCYIVGCEQTMRGAIIDPGDNPRGILREVDSLGLTIDKIINAINNQTRSKFY